MENLKIKSTVWIAEYGSKERVTIEITKEDIENLIEQKCKEKYCSDHALLEISIDTIEM